MNFFGLPSHPFVVHAAVVLLPLAALGVIVVALWPSLRRKYSGPVLLLSGVAFLVMPLASSTGEDLTRYVPKTDLAAQHVSLGESGIVAGGAVFAAALVLWWINRSRSVGRTMERLIVILAIIMSLAATYQIARIGHSGAASVWSKLDGAQPQQAWAEDGGE